MADLLNMCVFNFMLVFMGILFVSYSFYTDDTSRVVEVPLQNLLNSAGCPLYIAAAKKVWHRWEQPAVQQ